MQKNAISRIFYHFGGFVFVFLFRDGHDRILMSFYLPHLYPMTIPKNRQVVSFYYFCSMMHGNLLIIMCEISNYIQRLMAS